MIEYSVKKRIGCIIELGSRKLTTPTSCTQHVLSVLLLCDSTCQTQKVTGNKNKPMYEHITVASNSIM